MDDLTVDQLQELLARKLKEQDADRVAAFSEDGKVSGTFLPVDNKLFEPLSVILQGQDCSAGLTPASLQPSLSIDQWFGLLLTTPHTGVFHLGFPHAHGKSTKYLPFSARLIDLIVKHEVSLLPQSSVRRQRLVKELPVLRPKLALDMCAEYLTSRFSTWNFAPEEAFRELAIPGSLTVPNDSFSRVLDDAKEYWRAKWSEVDTDEQKIIRKNKSPDVDPFDDSLDDPPAVKREFKRARPGRLGAESVPIDMVKEEESREYKKRRTDKFSQHAIKQEKAPGKTRTTNKTSKEDTSTDETLTSWCKSIIDTRKSAVSNLHVHTQASKTGPYLVTMQLGTSPAVLTSRKSLSQVKPSLLYLGLAMCLSTAIQYDGTVGMYDYIENPQSVPTVFEQFDVAMTTIPDACGVYVVTVFLSNGTPQKVIFDTMLNPERVVGNRALRGKNPADRVQIYNQSLFQTFQDCHRAVGINFDDVPLEIKSHYHAKHRQVLLKYKGRHEARFCTTLGCYRLRKLANEDCSPLNALEYYTNRANTTVRDLLEGYVSEL